jgi:hypothetical protein
MCVASLYSFAPRPSLSDRSLPLLQACRNPSVTLKLALVVKFLFSPLHHKGFVQSLWLWMWLWVFLSSFMPFSLSGLALLDIPCSKATRRVLHTINYISRGWCVLLSFLSFSGDSVHSSTSQCPHGIRLRAVCLYFRASLKGYLRTPSDQMRSRCSLSTLSIRALYSI